MKFEHILQVYWSKGFFFGGKLFYTNNLNYNTIFNTHLFGFGYRFKTALTKRLELTTFSLYYSNLYYLADYCLLFHKKFLKVINIILSQISNVNLSLKELQKLNIIRKFLIKSYSGYCHAIGKPVRGQRTWSNGWNSFKCNNTLRNFINKIKQLTMLKGKSAHDKINYKVIKKQYSNKSTNSKTKLQKNKLLKKSWF